MNPSSFIFPVQERLKSRKAIQSLFSDGQSHAKYPVRIVYREVPELTTDAVFQVSFVVPAKKIKKATLRNLIRRRMKEAFRLEAQIVRDRLKTQEKRIQALFIFTADEEKDYKTILSSMQKILKQLVYQL